jgi:hypothetical protein
VGSGEFVVDLYRVAKLECGFLKLLVFQVSFALRYVFGFRFLGIAAAGKGNCGCQKKTQNAYMKGITSALASH